MKKVKTKRCNKSTFSAFEQEKSRPCQLSFMLQILPQLLFSEKASVLHCYGYSPESPDFR